MTRRYTETELIKLIDEEAKNIDTFYKCNAVNFSGKTSDTNESYTEIIADWIIEEHTNFGILNNITDIHREKGYFTKTHDGKDTSAKSNRIEEITAKALYRRSSFNEIGVILDYQTPLKNVQSDTAGKIDLLSYDENKNIVLILELKKQDSTESMLRCVLESYTYLQTIKNHDKFIEDFKIGKPNANIKSDAVLKAAPLVFEGSRQYKEMMSTEHPALHKLIKVLDIEPFYITGDCEANFDIHPF